ncbi:MAG: low temperature requirement protein A [Nocardioides sp.]
MSEQSRSASDPRNSAPNGTRPSVRAALNHWFRRPPRIHGEVDHERTVSFLELFYDLMFVVLVSQAAHTLAEHPTWAGLADFLLVFALIWIAWLNGSLHHEGHGREDGRGRGNIFGQMLILVVLAVFTGHATTEDGRAFAVTYTVLLAWLAWQWNTVRHYDVVPEYRATAARYIAMIVVSGVMMTASVFVGDQARWWLWVAVAAINTLVPLADAMTDGQRQPVLMPTESLAERFGLLTIIVLGEVVVGVVNGVSGSDRDALVIVTALLALGIGFGFWWNYFDLMGRRPPRATYAAFMPWVLLHLPLTAVIAASGAGMVGLIEHAHESRTPTGPGWLLAAGSAGLLVIVPLLTSLMNYDEHFAVVLPQVRRNFAIGSVACLAIGVLLPAPWLLALLLAAVHMVVWWSIFVQLARHTDAFLPHSAPAD